MNNGRWLAGVVALLMALGSFPGPRFASQAQEADARAWGAATRPDLDLLLRQTIENSARDRQTEEHFKARYAFTRVKVTETRDGDGRLKKRSEQHLPHPLPEIGGSSPGESTSDPGEPEAKRPYERHDFKVDRSLLSRFRFEYVGTEQIDGRAAWIVDFEPVSDRLPARSLKDRFINLTAGRLWIDCADETLSRATFRLTGSLNVAAGLVGALKRCEVLMERGRTEDGLWYPRRLHWQIEGRKFFSTRRMEHRDEITDVRRRGTTESSQRAAMAGWPGPN